MVNRSNSNSMASSRPTRSRSSRVRGNTRVRTNIRLASVNEQAINNSDEPPTSISITNDAVFLNFQSCQCDDASIVKLIMDYSFRYVPLHEVINFSHERVEFLKIFLIHKNWRNFSTQPSSSNQPLNPAQQSSSTQPTNLSPSSSSTQSSLGTQPSILSQSSTPVQSNISFQNANPPRSLIAS
ncbi:unnamed protein product [Brachionus calyciflorus]|uniref:Uncharacterized protein n=1 Tax=Brachionus calyciflorus TaxID=104777 RepID=A0A813W8Y0_9BILA|nr:unnamed protein product [Brachionus calyciflorus]